MARAKKTIVIRAQPYLVASRMARQEGQPVEEIIEKSILAYKEHLEFKDDPGERGELWRMLKSIENDASSS